MADLSERSEHRPRGIFDVRDHFREQQRADRLAATVSRQVRFAVKAVVMPTGRVEPQDWVLDTRPTLSGLAVFLDRVVEGRRPRILRTLSPAATSVELRVSCPRFQPKDVTFQPTTGRRVQIDLTPAVDYPFAAIARPHEHAPTLLRGSIRTETGQGVPDAQVAVQQGLYTYRTDRDGGWVIVLPDNLQWMHPQNVDVLDVDVQVTLTPAGTWQTAELLPDGHPAPSWSRDGLVFTHALTAVRGTTVSAPRAPAPARVTRRSQMSAFHPERKRSRHA